MTSFESIVPANCKLCPLCKTRTKIVFAYGSKHPNVLICGEAPGREEDMTGTPFVGRAGKILRHLLNKSNLQEITLTNIVKCRPVATTQEFGIIKQTNRTPLPEEIDACSPYLEREISTLKPKVIVPVGLTATKFFVGNQIVRKKASKLFNMRYDYKGIPVVPTWHPAYLLRGNLFAFEEVLDAFYYAEQIIKETPKKPQYYIVKTEIAFEKAINKLQKANFLSADLETTHFLGKIIGIGFSWEDYTGIYIPLQAYNGVFLEPFWEHQEDIISALRDVFLKQYPNIVWHNATYDTRILWRDWKIPLGECHDTLLMWGALADTKMDGSPLEANLAFLTKKFLPWLEPYKGETTVGGKEVDMYKFPLEVIGKRGALDAIATLLLYKIFDQKLIAGIEHGGSSMVKRK